VAYCGQDSSALAALALGALEDDELREVEEHVSGCEWCRTELEELVEVRAVLDDLPPEALLDGPPEGGEMLLQRTLRAARAERARTRLPRRLLGVAVAAAVAVLAVGGGVLFGRSTAPTDQAEPRPPTATASLPPPGTRVAEATDPATQARITVRVEPAAGWVRVNAAVTGIPVGQRCRLVVVGKDGTREIAGSWQVSTIGATEGTTLNGSALVAPTDVAAVRVENFDGRQFVTVNV
jgi:hypothetical protein